ncbi:MAG: hypothetical protein ABI367_00035 [Mucilaginibacter sp.]
MKSDIGNKEWLNDYGQLKKVNPNNPFTVPEGYFNELSRRIVSGIRLNDLKQNEQQEFSVPENYFDDLSGNIMSRINIEQTLNQQTGFTVPDNYFEQLNAQIHSRVVVEEVLVTTPQALTVPEGYFDQLNKNILNQTVNLDMVKRKGIIRQLYNAPAFKYATAACFVAIVGAGLFFRPTSDITAHKSSYLHKQLSGVSDQEMESYLKLYADGNEAQHIINAEGLTVNDARLQSDLNDYVDSQ